LRFFLLKIAILDFEVSAIIYGADTDFLDGFFFHSCRERDFDWLTGQ
jgi:hypothetical protein